MPRQTIDDNTRALYRLVSGLLTYSVTPSVRTAIDEAIGEIGQARYTDAADKARRKLAEAIQLNLIDRHEYPYELLVRRYGLCESAAQFRDERVQFCRRVVELCGLGG